MPARQGEINYRAIKNSPAQEQTFHTKQDGQIQRPFR